MPTTQRQTAARHPHYQFPYVRFHGKSYPLIPVTLRKGRFSVNTFALLDSGASISVFRPEIARALRIPTHSPRKMRLNTGSGGFDIRLSRVEINVEKTKFNARIGFSNAYAANFNILGREGFFYRFSVCFNEMMKTVIMIPLDRLG